MSTTAPVPTPAPSPSTVVDQSARWKLLAKKCAMAGGVSFLAVFIPAVLTALDEIEGGEGHSFSTEFWFSLLAGAVGAAVRAIIAVLPWNFVATDALHSIGGSRASEVKIEPPAKT